MAGADEFGLSGTDLVELFPFHIAFDRELRVLQRGAAIARICPELVPGAVTNRHFQLIRPDVPWNIEALALPGTLFLLRHTALGLLLRGEMRRLPDGRGLLFLGSPWVTNLGELRDLGLSIRDFPIHDSISDFLFLIQSKNVTLAETERLAAAVSAQRVELRLANRMLAAQYAVSQGLADARSRAAGCSLFLNAIVAHLGCELAALWVCDDARGLSCEACAPASSSELAAAALAEGRELLLKACADGRAFPTLSERPSEGRLEQSTTAYRHVLTLPLLGAHPHSHGVAVLQLFRNTTGFSDNATLTTLDAICARFVQFTRHQDAEQALRESEARLRAILDNAAEGIIAVDEDGTVRLLNAVAARMLGCSLHEIIGGDVEMLPGVAALLRSMRTDPGGDEGRAVGTYPLAGVRSDGSQSSLRLSVSAVQSAGKRLFIGIIRDFTEEVRAHRELELAKAMAESADRAKSEFLATVSHEIRTPLNVIIGMTELAVSTKSPSEQQQFLARVRSNAEALLTLINTMLDLSKIEASQVEIDNILFDLPQLVSSVTDAMGARLSKGTVELVAAVSPLVPSQVLGDPVRMRQILVNLVGNAVKFTASGEIVVSVEVLSQAADSVKLLFCVSDTGIGIPRQVQPRIFEKFFQVDSSTSRRFGGTGLGLTISRSLIALLGGRIWFDSEPGSGSRFYVECSLALPATQPAKPRALRRAVRVLVVDDSQAAGNAMAAALRHRGFDVELAADGAAAKALLTSPRDQFAVAVLDAHLPGVRPSELAALSQTGGLGQTKLLWTTQLDITGMREPNPVRYDCLLKPITNARLLDAVELICGLPRDSATESSGPLERMRPPSDFRILVVEDNLDNQQLAWHTLTKAGYRTEIVANGKFAVERTRAATYDLILMDIEMPELDGFAATAAIRRDEAVHRLPRVPIIAVTAHAVQSFRQQCIDADMDDYVTKPMSRQRLVELVDRYVAKCGTAAAPPPVQAVPPPALASQPEPPAGADVPGPKISCAPDPDIEALVPEYLHRCQRNADELPGLLASKSWHHIANIGHNLKGTASSFGCPLLGTIGAQLEQAARRSNADACERLVVELVAGVAAWVAELTQPRPALSV
jgi:PAS domain S-box-containing protein